MNAVIEFCRTLFNPLVVIFTVANLASMGLQVEIPPVLRTLRNPKFLGLVVGWGRVAGPALGYLITRLIPLAEPYATVMLLTSLAPSAPFLPPMIEKSRGDVGFAGALVPLVMIGTVVLMPLMAPLLIKDVTISTAALAKPLLLTILLPLVIGAVMRHFADKGATTIFPAVKGLALLSTALTILWCLVLYGQGMLDTAGELAFLSLNLFMIGMGVITYFIGFGMKQNQRSVMALGMGTRNIAAVFAGVLAIPNGDSRMVAMVVMWTLWSFILALVIAPVMGRHAGQAVEGGAA